jgi:hypothetical protein
MTTPLDTAEPTKGPEVKTETLDPDLDMDQIRQKMCALLEAGDSAVDKMILVDALLSLRGQKGRKLLFARPEVFQIFDIWSRKMQGEARL